MTRPPREKPQENVKRKKNHENNPCTLPTKKNIKKKLNLISIRVKILMRVRIICRLTISIKRLRHVTRNNRVHSVDSRGLGWRIHGSVEDTKLSTNKQHTLLTTSGVCQSAAVLGFTPAALRTFRGLTSFSSRRFQR